MPSPLKIISPDRNFFITQKLGGLEKRLAENIFPVKDENETYLNKREESYDSSEVQKVVVPIRRYNRMR